QPGLTKATYGTGVFVLAHLGEARPTPRGGLLPTVAWSVDGRVEWALDGGVFTAGALLEWLSRDLGLAADPPALAAADATAAGAAALAAVGAGLWPSPAAIADHIPIGERVEPTRDAAWRQDARAAWRAFVERAVQL